MKDFLAQVAADLQAIENPYVAYLVDRPFLAFSLFALLVAHLVNDEKLRRKAKAEDRHKVDL